MSGYIQRDDGSWGWVDSDGFVHDFDTTKSPGHALEGRFGLPEAVIDVAATSVVDTELPKRTPFVGPPRPIGLSAELVERVADAGREWGER